MLKQLATRSSNHIVLFDVLAFLCYIIISDLEAQYYLRSWYTTHQLFQQLLTSTGPTDTLTIRTFDYTISEDSDHPFPFMKMSMESSHTHVLDIKRKKQAKKGKLPLGLKMPRKRKKTASVKPKSGAAGSKASNPSGLVKHVKLNSDEGGYSLEDFHAEPSEQDDFIIEPSSESDISSDSAFHSSSESDTDDEALVNPDQRHEERVTDKILESHDDLHKAEPLPISNTPAQKRPLTTQCNSSIGVRELGTQLASRLATCKHCGNKIQRLESRVGYAFSLKKIHCYLHVTCFPQYLEKEGGDFSQAWTFAQDWLNTNAPSDELKDLHRDVRAMAVALKNVMGVLVLGQGLRHARNVAVGQFEYVSV